MTAPNIVDIAAIKGESSVKTTLTTSPSTIVFNQVDSNQVYKLNSVVVTNVDGTNAADVTVQLARQGVNYSIISTASVPADASLIVVSKETGIYLEEGDAIQAFASANGDLDISVSYETIAETANTLVTRGLVLYLDAADLNSYPGSGTTWYDLSTDASIGELVNSPSFSPDFFIFNGSSNYIKIPNSTTLDVQTFTVEVWVKTNNTNQNGFWFEKGTVNTQYSLFQETAAIRCRVNIGGSIINTISLTTATYMNTTDWYHVVFTFTSGSQVCYINGSQVGTGITSGTISTNSGGMSIGAYGGYTGSKGYYYNGSLAMCRVYNRVLSATEVLQNYNAQKSRFGL